MYLSRANLQNITPSSIKIPGPADFLLPEKVLQFGTGVLLRALPDFIIDKANKNGFFNGRIVIVKSTGSGDTDVFNKQDGLYTVCIRGIETGKKVEENVVISSVSRVLSASNEWDSILETAASPHMQVVVSNTTEVGITYREDNVHAAPPLSFPGKLLSFLYRRYTIFKGDATKGMVIIPTELIPGNADKLLVILKQLASVNNLETPFINWLDTANYFCNSLVDRIVPGKPALSEQQKIEEYLRYNDELMITCEAYALWAIESDDDSVKKILSFAQGGDETVIAADIHKFRELKLRLLNGPHTFSCGLAWLAGFKTVKEAMADDYFFRYIQDLMFDEIIPAITGDAIDKSEATVYAAKVLDRFRNNFIDHQWLNICLQYSSKMRLRNIEVIVNYNDRFHSVPSYMALGMAAHILFMKITRAEDGKFYGDCDGSPYLVEDQNAALYAGYWKDYPAELLADKILMNENLWGIDLSAIKDFSTQVSFWLQLMIDRGAGYALQPANKK